MESDLESRFTRPTDRCPYPEYWHSDNADATEWEVIDFLGGLVRALQPELVVETGTHQGYAAQAMAWAIEKNGHGHLITIEIEPTRVAAARKMLPAWVEVVEGSSLEYIPNREIDLLYVDGARERVEEFIHLEPWLQAGAFAVFHDTAHEWMEVEVRTRIEDVYPVRALHLPTPRGLTVMEVLGWTPSWARPTS